jgi:hypothetical protein
MVDLFMAFHSFYQLGFWFVARPAYNGTLAEGAGDPAGIPSDKNRGEGDGSGIPVFRPRRSCQCYPPDIIL